MHGGYILIHDFDNDNKSLKLQMGGGCQGCARARDTLKIMIENMLKERFPDIKDIEDVTNHFAGENPYYV